jgi:ATP-dependent Clp protease adaptor protein ClpS
MSTEVLIDEKVEQIVSVPDRYKVVFLNDDHTPMDFVIDVLVKVFRHSQDTAKNLTMQVHQEGSAIVGVYSFELAEQKSIEATTISRQQVFPLQIRVEKE